MHFTPAIIFLGTVALAAAAPLDTPNHPPVIKSKAFRLVVNVTDLSTDISPPVHGTEIFPYFVNSALIRAGVAQSGAGSVFLQFPDPTPQSPMWAPFGAQLITQQGGPDNILGLTQNYPPILDPTDFYDNQPNPMTFTPGQGTKSVQLTTGGYYSYVRPREMSGGLGDFAICDSDLGGADHHGNPRRMRTLDFFNLSLNDKGDFAVHVPKGCTKVKLVAQCDVLRQVPENSAAAPFHKAAQEVRCYENVMKIDWGRYNFEM